MPAKGSETWRVFCAIDIGPEAAAQASNHINHLRQQFSASSASWNRDGRFHLTLKFIGEIPRACVDGLSLAADRAVNNLSPFSLRIEGSGVFPGKGMPKVLWLAIHDPFGKLAELQSHLEAECVQAGFAKEERPFRPHLTIARVRKPHDASALAVAHKEVRWVPVEFPVAELLVIRSELSSAGSRYWVISSHQLK